MVPGGSSATGQTSTSWATSLLPLEILSIWRPAGEGVVGFLQGYLTRDASSGPSDNRLRPRSVSRSGCYRTSVRALIWIRCLWLCGPPSSRRYYKSHPDEEDPFRPGRPRRGAIGRQCCAGGLEEASPNRRIPPLEASALGRSYPPSALRHWWPESPSSCFEWWEVRNGGGTLDERAGFQSQDDKPPGDSKCPCGCGEGGNPAGGYQLG